MSDEISHSIPSRGKLGAAEFFTLTFLTIGLLLVLSIREFDQPDIETTLVRMYDGYPFLKNIFDFSGLSTCRANLNCNAEFYDFYLFRQILFMCMFISGILFSIFFYRSNHKAVCLILSVCYPSSVYFLTNFTNEIGVYAIALLLPFIAFQWKLIFLVVASQIDVGNTIVLIMYLAIDRLFPRSLLFSVIFFASGVFSYKLLTIIFGFVSGGKLFDVLNYILDVTYGELLPYVLYYPVTILSLLLMTPLKVGAVSSLAGLIYLIIVLASKGNLQGFLRSFLASSEVQTVILVVALLPAYGYGKYFLFVIPMFVALVLRHSSIFHLLSMNTIIISGFTVETLILAI